MNSLLDIRVPEAWISIAAFSQPWSLVVPEGDVSILYVFRKGSAVFEVKGDKPVEVDANCMITLPGGAGHMLRDSIRAKPETHIADPFINLEDFDFANALRSSATVIIRATIPVSSNPLPKVFPAAILVTPDDVRIHQRLEQIINLVLLEYTAPKDAREAIVKRLAEIIAIEFTEFFLIKGDLNWDSRLIDSRIKRAINAIHSHLDHPWTVASLANEALLSRSAFASRFREVIGDTPVNYLYKTRMHRAACEIRNGKLSLSRIAEMVGYESEGAFSKAFRRNMGTTPSRYRANHLRDGNAQN